MEDQTFKANPKLNKYFKTSDGTKFFTEHDAKAHARSLKDKDVETVKRKQSKGQPKEEKEKSGELTHAQKAAIRKTKIMAIETVEDVEKALKDESAKTVIKAGKERIEALKEASKSKDPNTDDKSTPKTEADAATASDGEEGDK